MSARCNILTILVDQFRYDALSCRGNGVVKTPFLDRLASQGALFTDATCTYPLCGPARASLLTGMYVTGHGFRENAEVSQPGLSEKLPTVDEILRDNGYFVDYFGKWHTGSAHRDCYNGGLPYFLKEYKAFLDAKYPFDGDLSGKKIDRYTKREYTYEPLDEMMASAHGRGISMPHHNEAGRAPAPSEDSLTAWTARQAIDFLDEYSGVKPFAVTCSILHPHAPLVAAEPYLSMYDAANIPMPENIADDLDYSVTLPVPAALAASPEGLGRYAALYYGLVTEVDLWVGRILEKLEEKGLADNTLVIFTSDHGELMGSHGTVSKMKLFEEAIRVPLIVRLPGAVRDGTHIGCAATGADIAPTILDFAGIPAPEHMQGASLKPALTDCGRGDEYAVCEMAQAACIRFSGYKLILNPLGQSEIRNRAMLYDLSADKGETKNLLSPQSLTPESAAKAEELRALLLKKMAALGCDDKRLSLYKELSFAN